MTNKQSKSRSRRSRSRSRNRSRSRKIHSKGEKDHLREPNRTHSSRTKSARPSSVVVVRPKNGQEKIKDTNEKKKKAEQRQACQVYQQSRQVIVEVVSELMATLIRQVNETFDLLLIEARRVNACACATDARPKIKVKVEEEECTSTQSK